MKLARWKKYLKEDGSDTVFRWLAEDPLPTTSQITYAEIHAAFARKLRNREITSQTYQRICRVFENDWKAMARVKLDDSLLSGIRKLLEQYPLRSADAIHLTSALYISKRSGA